MTTVLNKFPIQVWRYRDAPKELQQLSQHGGDEDWLALVPESSKEDYIPWMEEGTSFGCCSVTWQKIQEGEYMDSWLVIGAHA